VFEERERLFKGVKVDLSGVLLLAGTGVDGDVEERIVVEDWYEVEDFVGGVEAEAHLDTEGRTEPGHDIV
jgi:hypothetical protein